MLSTLISRTSRHPWVGCACILLALCTLQRPLAAADSVGVIVQLKGKADVGNEGQMTAASVGTSVAIGNRVRTAKRGELRLALHDGTIVLFGPETEVVIDRHGFDATSGRVETTLTLVQGRVRSNVEPDKAANVRIASATATADAKQGEFVVEYDESDAVTHVTGVRGEVTVHSALDPSGSEVLVTAQQVTSVRRGAAPEPLRPAERLAVARVGQEEGVLGSTLPEAALWAEQLLSVNRVEPHETVGGVASTTAIIDTGERPRSNSVKEGNDVSSLLGQNLANQVQLGIDLGK